MELNYLSIQLSRKLGNTKKSNKQMLSFVFDNFSLFLFAILILLHLIPNRLQTEANVYVSQVVNNTFNSNSLFLAEDLLISPRKALMELIQATTVS